MVFYNLIITLTYGTNKSLWVTDNITKSSPEQQIRHGKYYWTVGQSTRCIITLLLGHKRRHNNYLILSYPRQSCLPSTYNFPLRPQTLSCSSFTDRWEMKEGVTRGWEQAGVRTEEKERIQGSSEQWKWRKFTYREAERTIDRWIFFFPFHCVCVCARCQPTGQSLKKVDWSNRYWLVWNFLKIYLPSLTLVLLMRHYENSFDDPSMERLM